MEAFNKVRRFYFNLKGRLEFFRFAKNPQDTHAIFRMADALQKSLPEEMVSKFMEKVYHDPDFVEAYEKKYWPTIPSLAELEAMDPESFGYALAAFSKKWNLDLDLFPAPKDARRNDYLLSRVYQAHDAWHVLTGYDPILEDEMALQAFGIGQYRQPLSLLIISGGILHLLEKSPERSLEMLEAVTKGFERGKKAKNLLTSRVLERLHEPLQVVRQDLGLI